MGAVREVAKAVESGLDHIDNILPRSGSGSANIWVYNLGINSSNDEKY